MCVSTHTLFTTFDTASLIAAGFKLQGNELAQVHAMTPTEVASRAFIQFDDISAKFTATARASGDMDIAGIGNIGIEDGTISFAFGLGMVESSEEIYFNEISSVGVALKKLEWQTAAVMDITVPIVATIEFADDLDLTLSPIISMTSSDLFTPDLPTMSIDLNLPYVTHSSKMPFMLVY